VTLYTSFTLHSASIALSQRYLDEDALIKDAYMTTPLKTNSIQRALLSLLALCLIFGALLLTARPLHAQDIPIVYQHFDTDMTLRADGVLHVRMVQQIRFDDTFSGAFYAIPLKNVTSISNVQLYGAATEADNYELDTVDLAEIAPDSVENNGNEVVVDWSFPQTRAGDVRLFVIEYDAFGAVWVYPQQDFVRWQAVNDDRSGITVDESVVKLTLPEIIPMDQVTTTSNLAGEAQSIAGNTLTFIADQSIPDGTPFEVEAHFPHGLLDVGVRPWQRDYDGEHLRVDVNNFQAALTLNTDGTLNVHEETALSVLEGALHQGSRSIKLLYMDSVSNPNVAVSGQPLAPGDGDCTGCYTINTLPRAGNWVYLDPDTGQAAINEDNAGVYALDWYTPLPIEAGQPLTTSIDYQVTGTLRVNADNQLLTWQVVPDFGQPVRQASLRLTLPPNVSPDQIVMDGPSGQGSPQLQTDGSLLYRFDGPVVPGAWQIALTLPANATRAQPPMWQQQFEDVIAQADAAAVTRARNALLQRVAGIVVIIVAILVALLTWFRWGRRRVKETLGGYVSAPPSQQSPALVSYLVDRKASERGILGSIFYLASLKLLEIDLQGEIKLRRLRNEPLQGTPRLTDAYGESVPIPRHLQTLFDQVLLPGLPLNEWASLDSLTPRLRASLPEIYASLAGDLQKYFIHIPGSGSDAIPGSLWFITYATLIGLMFFEIIPWLVGFILGFIALLVFVVWSAIYHTTQGSYNDEGARAADQWRRFKTYLQNIKKYGDLAAAQEILDRYFGYAVALGVENVVLAQASDMGSQPPVWMPGGYTSGQSPIRPRPRDQTSTPGFPWPRPSTPRPSLPPSAPAQMPQLPSLAGMSAQLGDSIRRASSNLGSLLSTAAGDANSAARTVVVNSQLRRREMEWKPNTPVNTVLDDILRQSVADAREVQAREIARRQAARTRPSESSGGGWNWSSGGSSSSSRSSSSFGRSSFGSSSRSSSSSHSSSGGSSRSGGGGRSGFR
jgi:hypothetical protein